MKHTQEPWEAVAAGNHGNAAVSHDDIVLFTDTALDPRQHFAKGEHNINRAVTCVNALAGKKDPAAWVKAAERVGALSAGPEFSVELAEAILDMKESMG